MIHHDRVVDHQIRRLEGIDQFGIATETLHGVAHRRQVNHGRHTGEILQHHPGGHERHLLAGAAFGVPVAERLDLLGGHIASVFLAQEVLQQHLQRERQAVDVVAFLERIQPVDFVLLALDVQRLAGVVTVTHGSSRNRSARKARCFILSMLAVGVAPDYT